MSLILVAMISTNPQKHMQESFTMHWSAEYKLSGKTVGDLAKRDTPSINKSALKITSREDFSLNHPFSHHIILHCPYQFFDHSLYLHLSAALRKSSRIGSWKTGVEEVKLRERAELTRQFTLDHLSSSIHPGAPATFRSFISTAFTFHPLPCVFPCNQQLAAGQRFLSHSHATILKHKRATLIPDQSYFGRTKQKRKCFEHKKEIMPRPLKFGRAKQSSRNQQADETPTGFPSPIFTGAVTPAAVESSDNDFPSSILTRDLRPKLAAIPRPIGSGGLHPLPRPPLISAVPQEALELSGTSVLSLNFTGALTPGAQELPRVVAIGGFLYQRIDINVGENVTMISNGQQGESSSAGAPFDQDEGTPIRQDSQTTSASRARKPKRKSNILRELEPHNQSPETLQPTNTTSLQPAPSIPRRQTKMGRGPEGHNKSPQPNSGIEQEQSPSKTPRSSQPRRRKQQRKSLMLREIEAHNQSPEPESNLEVELVCHLKGDWGDVPLTRSVRQNLVNLAQGEPPTPRKNLNLKKLMLAEFSGIEKGTKTFYAEHTSDLGPSSHQRQQEAGRETGFRDEEEDEEENLPANIKTNGRSHPQRMLARQIIPRQMANPVESSQRDPKLAAKVAAKSAWATRDHQKEKRIIELIKAPGYKPHPSQQEMDVQSRKKPAYHETAEVPDGFKDAFQMEDGLYVFTPTAAAFSDFGRFLRDVEEIAGRKMGVVKVIVPSECVSGTSVPSGSKSPEAPVIETVKISISLNRNAVKDPSKIYDMLITKKSTSLGADEWLQKIQLEKDRIIKKRVISTAAMSRNDVWKESHLLKPFTEKRMTRRCEEQKGAVLCALNEPATPPLRAALNCRDPKIENFIGNRLASSPSTQPGISESVFHISGGAGPLSQLQMNQYAAYSLNYHHSGAPRMLTVTRPEHYAKLEEVMYITQNSGTLSGRPRDFQTCSQFAKHRPMYVPHATLSTHDVDYTNVVQHQGEMVITFPYAYHQAYTSGPNITEELLYASDRCKVFHRENLYQHCSRKCAAGQPNSFDLKDVFSDTLGKTRSGRSDLDFPSILRSPRRSREASTSQNRDADDHPFKRLSGLMAMDRVSEAGDGEWIPRSARAYPFQPSTPRKPTRMTSSPWERDIWDPDHAFEGSHRSAGRDEGSPIGGSEPMDIITGRILGEDEWRKKSRRSRKRDDESDEAPRKHRRRHR